MDSLKAVQNAIDYIEEHLCESLELQDIADKAFMSVPNLYRVFYTVTGHPIKEYIRKRRFSLSAWYLRYDVKPVVDIAFICGFDSYQAFAKMFKKLIGITPTEYREADGYFVFEPMNLLGNESYTVEKDLSERYPDVKVVRFCAMKVALYRHQSCKQQGIENEALNIVFSRLERLGWEMKRIRLFGYNVELPSKEQPHGYEVMIPLEGVRLDSDSNFSIGEFPGGLYAVGKSLEISERTIVAAWDRLLSEWLPKSTFDLGEHQYVEEFLTYHGSVTRMKLYLPIQRKIELEKIERMDVKPFLVYCSSAISPDAQKLADNQMITWLTKNGMRGRSDLRLFMSHSYDIEIGECYRYELSVLIPKQDSIIQEGACSMKTNILGGGLYACLTTGAYGLMTGVLHKIRNWVYTNESYMLDESRQWFAEYLMGEGTNIETSTSVRCFLPIIRVASQ